MHHFATGVYLLHKYLNAVIFSNLKSINMC